MALIWRLAILCSAPAHWRFQAAQAIQAVSEQSDSKPTIVVGPPPTEDLEWTSGAPGFSSEAPEQAINTFDAFGKRHARKGIRTAQQAAPESARSAKSSLIEDPQTWAEATYNLTENERQEHTKLVEVSGEQSYVLNLTQEHGSRDKQDDTGDGNFDIPDSEAPVKQDSHLTAPILNPDDTSFATETLSHAYWRKESIPATRHPATIPSARDLEQHNARSAEESSDAQSPRVLLSGPGDDFPHRELTDADPLTAEVKVLLPLALTHSTAEIMLQLTDVPQWSEEQPFFLAPEQAPEHAPSLLLAPLAYDKVALSAGKAVKIHFCSLSPDTDYRVRLNWSLKAPDFPQGWSFRTAPRMVEL